MPDTVSEPWLSAHIAIGCGLRTPGCDAVVTDVVRPFVHRQTSTGAASQWFFVRYGEGGDHLRLRLLPAPGVAHDRLADELLAHTGARRGVTRIDLVEYRPELERYGGPRAIAVAEEFFHHSSEVAVSLLEDPGELTESARLGRAMACILLIAFAFCDNSSLAAAFLRTYARSYLRSLTGSGAELAKIEERFDKGFEAQENALRQLVHELWASYCSGAPTLTPLNRFRASLVGIRRKFEELANARQIVMWNGVPLPYRAAVAGVIPSYIHMTSNRLGTTIPQESYLAHVAALSLEKNGNVNAN